MWPSSFHLPTYSLVISSTATELYNLVDSRFQSKKLTRAVLRSGKRKAASPEKFYLWWLVSSWLVIGDWVQERDFNTKVSKFQNCKSKSEILILRIYLTQLLIHSHHRLAHWHRENQSANPHLPSTPRSCQNDYFEISDNFAPIQNSTSLTFRLVCPYWTFPAKWLVVETS